MNPTIIEHESFAFQQVPIERISSDLCHFIDYYHIYTSVKMTPEHISIAKEFLTSNDNNRLERIQSKTEDMASEFEDYYRQRYINMTVFEIDHSFRIYANERQLITQYRIDDGRVVRFFVIAANCYLEPDMHDIIRKELDLIAKDAEHEAASPPATAEDRHLHVDYHKALFSCLEHHEVDSETYTELKSKILSIVKFGTRIIKCEGGAANEQYGQVDTGLDDNRVHLLLPKVMVALEENKIVPMFDNNIHIS